MRISALDSGRKVLALCGGVGGAKLALGLSHLVDGDNLVLVVNTGDDFRHFGLPVSPDIDTVMYTLAGINNMEQGWGISNESWQAMNMLKRYGGEDWFQLGDRDIGTHLMRHELLSRGKTLSEVTALLSERLGITARIVPMSDDPVATLVRTGNGDLEFQDYFVRQQCKPRVTGLYYRRDADARPHGAVLEALSDPKLETIIICPSNPFLSVQPILELPGIVDAVRQSAAPVIAVSPIVSGQAIKGPTAKIMRELGIPASASAVAEHYLNLLDGFVLDTADADQQSSIEAMGLKVTVTNTVMNSLQDRVDLAANALRFAKQLRSVCAS